MTSLQSCVFAYDVHGNVNEPLHIEDSQVTAAKYLSVITS